MISLFFGLPGCGKSSYAVWLIVRELALMDIGKSPYKRIVTNIEHSIFDDRVFIMSYKTMRSRDLGAGTLVLIDEAQMDFSDRGFKNFGREDMQFFTQHRRYGYDLLLFTQQWDGIDRKVRVLTCSVSYVRKSFLLPFVSHVYPINYGVEIPKRKDKENPRRGEIYEAYYRWTFIQRFSHRRFDRRLVYGLYDSFIRPDLPPFSLDDTIPPSLPSFQGGSEHRRKRLIGAWRRKRANVECHVDTFGGNSVSDPSFSESGRAAPAIH